MVSVEESRARVIVVIEWVLFGLASVGIIIVGIVFAKEISDLFKQEDSKSDHGGGSSSSSHTVYLQAILVTVLVVIVLTMFFNIMLTKGVHQANICCCKTWYILGIIGIVFSVLDIIAAIATFNIIALVVKGAVLAYRIYAVRTIMAFTRSIEHGTGGVVFSTFAVQPQPPQQYQPQPPQFQPQQIQQPPPYTTYGDNKHVV